MRAVSFRKQELLSCAGKVKEKVTVILSQLLHQQSRPPDTAFDPSLFFYIIIYIISRVAGLQ